MSPGWKLLPLMDTTTSPPVRVGVMELPLIWSTGIHSVATSTAAAATVTSA